MKRCALLACCIRRAPFIVGQVFDCLAGGVLPHGYQPQVWYLWPNFRSCLKGWHPLSGSNSTELQTAKPDLKSLIVRCKRDQLFGRQARIIYHFPIGSADNSFAEMVSVASLLNPLPSASESCPGTPDSRFQTPTSHTLTPDFSVSSSKKLKMSKSTASLVKAKAKGKVNYQPYEEQDEITSAIYRRFQVEPIGHIGDYPKHIPYKSDKKTFEQRTGRTAIEGKISMVS